MSSTTIATPGTGPSPERTASRRRQVLVGAVVVVLIAAAAAVWLLSSKDAKVPYTDARSTGALTLCADGKPVTSGSTTRKPFVDLAVGATGVDGQASASGRTATLYAFQPRQGTGSDEWSGQLLTAASTYTNAEHPMAQATEADIPLKDFLAAFPTRWDGFIEIRLYLASPSAGVGDKYDTANIKIHDGTWKVVGATGKSSCTDGDATSNETSLNTTP